MKKIYFFLPLILLISLDCFGHNEGNEDLKRSALTNGFGLGTILAAIASWERNKSLLWAFIHGIFSWFYVLYFVWTRRPSERKK